METEPLQKLTHSSMSCFRTCPRKHQLRYGFGLRPDADSLPMRVGSAFATRIEHAGKGEIIPADVSIVDDPYEAALVDAMVEAHLDYWQYDPIVQVDSEITFSIPLVNPDTERASTTWTLDGKIDRIVKRGMRVVLMEYKTTTRDFSPGSDYWVQIRMDQQLSVYVIAANADGWPIEEILYDVTRRPTLKPLKATPEESRKYTKDGAIYKTQRTEDETPEAYGARVRADLDAKKDSSFARIEIARLTDDLDECKREIWQQQKAMRTAQREGYWYRNPSACVTVSFNCEYLPICQNKDLETQTPNGFKRSERTHSELSETPPSAG